MDINLNINAQIFDNPQFAEKPTWAKTLYFFLWCKSDFAGFVDLNWKVAKVHANLPEELTEEEMKRGMEGLIAYIPESPSVGYMKDFIHTARAQKGIIKTSNVHLKIYKDMIARKQRFKVSDPVQIIRENNPGLSISPLTDAQVKEPQVEDPEKESKKQSPALLYRQLGIPNKGYISYYDEQQGLTQSVSVDDDNKSSSYTEQDDGVEDIFEGQPKEEYNNPEYPDMKEDQKTPPMSSLTQQKHEEWLSRGHYVTKDNTYARYDGQDIRVSFIEIENNNKPSGESLNDDEEIDVSNLAQF